MRIEEFIEVLGADFYAGIPDSQLKPLCDYLIQIYGVEGEHHRICANEGNCTAMAAGYHLATGKVPVVYLQNSGLGNIFNPVASLLNKAVYAIPCIFVVGWRGEPGIHDEPQHIFQGAVSQSLLKDMEIDTFILDRKTTQEELIDVMLNFRKVLKKGCQVAFLVRKRALEYPATHYSNNYSMRREEILEELVSAVKDDIIFSTTGKTSRELFEIRTRRGMDHAHDFLTVGSMGHTSSIAMGAALQHPEHRFWCIDGDGALLMHMGAMAILGTSRMQNIVHIVINNGAHESVGGQPTAAAQVDLCAIAKGCGYVTVLSVSSPLDLKNALKVITASKTLCFLEIHAAIGARGNLGRPTLGPCENKALLMNTICK